MKVRGRYIAAILALGWFLGAASGFVLMRSIHPLMHRSHGRYYRNRLLHEIHLSPEQIREVDGILQRNHEKLDKIFEQDRPEIEAVRQDTHREIRKLLNPAQQATFDLFQAKMKERFDRYITQRLRAPSDH